MFNYNHLYYFYVTARLGGVSNAAKYLHISQPSLSSQIKVLESSIDQKLFEKRGRNLHLTPEGERTFAYCKKMFDVAADFAESLKSPTEKQSQRIRIGVSDQVERPFIADLLAPLIREQRRAVEKTFFVSSAPSDALLTQLRSREIDLLLTNKPIYADDVTELATAEMPVNLMVSTKNLKERKMRISRNTSAVDFLAAVPWGLIIPSYKMKLRHETDLFFQDIRARKKVVFESDIISVVGRAIVDGAGVGFLPVPYVMDEVSSGILTLLGPKAGYWKHTLYLLGRKDEKEDETIQDLKKTIKRLEKI
ncbi:LysR family transcriptional regulator [Bdellovibrio bacteriovorus]|uniref:Transcriptional regulator, LysR family n=1 Tax=Bdellovibrio bacteriovorus (strain ATCC 15356 / DSM 50701 / NCIMB 9529 / HD100) TaxID=264462 RepID=Q6MHC9_BDEBA|nr:LysR family transcriptional regulator [Bdellovibrio bacteriovorus]AHZ83964.1 LysR family transcriptional regulator [Bdellovibrio bacteriovorus]BEV69942.1 HTH-type transcriptional regulator HdfR [Bdellovibrio bacteriovorus]CAE80998.1 transcriptional regulator, LysR family [Bdellovibrio bacteriovorus HD100]